MAHYQGQNSIPTKKVTIGVPVFNVADYIYASLTSALNQDMDDIEILIIDDCGTDSSMEIVHQLQNSHSKGKYIRIIRHEQNKGIAEARNTILHEAQGKYLFFLDSDDLIMPSTISILYQAAEREKAELTYGSTTVREMDGKEHPFFIFPQLTISGEHALVNYIYKDIRQNIPNYVWNILFLTKFLRNHRFSFPPFRVSEDAMFNELIQSKVTKAVLLPNITYVYVKRPNSLMNFQSRDTISIQEALTTLNYSEMQKKMCQQYCHEPYYGGKCAKTMKNILYRVCGILKHRNQLTGSISDRELRNIMQHPASLSEILNFKQQKCANLLFWLLGKLPPKLSIWIIRIIGKQKGYIS